MELSIVVPSHPSGKKGYTTTTISPLQVSPTSGIPRSFAALAQTTLWDPGDEVVRRFSEPAVDASSQRLAAHITSAKTAYAKAFVSIQRSTKGVDTKQLLVSSTERDVAQLAVELDESSAAEEKGPVTRLVGVLHHYHDVFDVLSQADFSYLPLIWGGMKLILIVRRSMRLVLL